jgi:hypothetical protein
MIQFSVRDTGIGIKPEDVQRVFEPFFQEEQTMYRKYGGTGLGLAICKGIVESQEGRIWLESELGKGTTFHFTIPLEPVRELKPIKVLFSPKESIEKKIAALFTEILGPLGGMEFETLRTQKGILKETLLEYVNELVKNGVITPETNNDFKKAILEAFIESGAKLKKDKTLNTQEK